VEPGIQLGAWYGIGTLIEAEFATGVWTDITTDAMVDGGWSWRHGITGTGPADRMADSGELTGVLRSVPVGTYAPGHAGCTAGWGLGTRIRVTIYDGAQPYVRFIGRVREIRPGAGQYRAGRYVAFVATDWLDDAAEVTVAGVAAQVSARGDEILTALVAAAATQPDYEDYDVGDSTFAYALDDVEDERTRLLTAVSNIAQSEQGYIYLRGTGELVFEGRAYRAENYGAPEVTLDDTMQGLAVRYRQGEQPTRVQVTVHPRRIDAAATTVLFKRYDISDDQDALELSPFTSVTVFGPYGDPNNANRRCGGTAMVAPVASTDYTANSQADGGGSDETASLSVTPSFTGNGVSLVVENTSASTIYVTLLQCRGKGIYDYDAVMVESGTGEALVQIDMPYADDVNIAAAVAAQVLAQWGSISPCEVTFRDTTAALLTAAVAVEIGARVRITETATGLDADYHVQAIRQRLLTGDAIETTWSVIPADATQYWILGTVGASELGTTTVLGY